jgi:hypothetical protein
MGNVTDRDALVYLASPYSHPDPAVRQQRFETVCFVAANLMREGHHIYSPIAHTHPIALKGDLPLGFDYWEAYDRKMLASCTDLWVVMMDGWRESKGVKAEIAIAAELGLPVKYI